MVTAFFGASSSQNKELSYNHTTDNIYMEILVEFTLFSS